MQQASRTRIEEEEEGTEAVEEKGQEVREEQERE